MKRNSSEAPLENLKKYLPENTFPVISHYLIFYKVQLTIKPSRKTVLGDYRRPYQGLGHRISVNGDLNRFAFFLTLVHELAHLLTFEKFGNRVKPHGKEWQACFKYLMKQVDVEKNFPGDIALALQKYMKNPAARSCTDAHLIKTLKKYDPEPAKNMLLIEDLAEGDHFIALNGEKFIRGKRLRKRYHGRNIRTGDLYVFSPLYEVKKVEKKKSGQ